MCKITTVLLLLFLSASVICGEPTRHGELGTAAATVQVGRNHPFFFLSGVHSRSRQEGALQVPEGDDDDEVAADAADDDDNDDDNKTAIDDNHNSVMMVVSGGDIASVNNYDYKGEDPETNTMDDDGMEDDMDEDYEAEDSAVAQHNNIALSLGESGSFVAPDGVIQIEAQSIADKPKMGKSGIWIPRAALEAIPDGSVLTLIDNFADDTEAMGKANRIVIRPNRKNVKRRVNRRGNKAKFIIRRIIGPADNRRRRGGPSKRPNRIQVINVRPIRTPVRRTIIRRRRPAINI